MQGLATVQGDSVEILNAGQYLQLAGPDFFNAQIAIDGIKWAGNVEIHIRSSDWYLHHHETDEAYHSVILHVVWEHDMEVFRKDNSQIPVLELKGRILPQVLENYNKLASTKSWIFCEKELESINSFTLENWKERLFFERLQRKSAPITEMASLTGYDWEAVLFCFIAKNFGLNTNGDNFLNIAKSIPFNIIRRESFEIENLEALLYGRAGLLDSEPEDTYPCDLQARYRYILHKYQLKSAYVDDLQFFKHRPDNFPTIRLSQLAQLYHKHQNLFSKLINSNSAEEIYRLFEIQVSDYWQTHYQFDRQSPRKRKALTKSFIDLIIINTVIPFRFAYARHTGQENSEDLMSVLKQIAPESNSIINKFSQYKVSVNSAYDTQSLLQLKNEYCAHKRCMQCAVGLELLKK